MKAKEYIKILDNLIFSMEDDLRIAKKNNNESMIKLLSENIELNKNFRQKFIAKNLHISK